MHAAGLGHKEIAKEIKRSPGAVGKALSNDPAKATPTLSDIFNYFFSAQSPETDLRTRARELALRAPETAALLSAVFREVSELLRKPDEPTTTGKGNS
jgi:hypothetical protein